MKRWRPVSALRRLTDALEDDLLNASEEELRDALGGNLQENAAWLRRRVERAATESGDGASALPDAWMLGRDSPTGWRH